jgi:type VI protein secretion system component VasK
MWGYDVVIKKYPEEKEIGYWRNHHELNDWMESLWSNSNGGSFNCAELELTSEDLDQLENSLKNFTSSQLYALEADQQFIDEARIYIAEGWRIIYKGWW